MFDDALTAGLHPMSGSRVFLSYSHLDEDHRERIDRHLALLRRAGNVELWTDHRIKPGEEIDLILRAALEQADVVLLVVTSDFIASDYCWGVEMAAAIRRHRAGTATVIPIIAEPCEWQDAPFGKLKALPRDGKPITKFRIRSEAYKQVAAGVREILESQPFVTTSTRSALDRVKQRLAGPLGLETRAPDSTTTARWTLRQWEIELSRLYPLKVLELPMYDLTLELVAYSTGIAEAMRKRNYTDAATHFAGTLAALCLMTSKARLDQGKFNDLTQGEYLDDLVWRKYPRLCPVCAEARCVCPALNVDSLSQEERQLRSAANGDRFVAARSQNELRPQDIDSWVELFDGLYGNIHAGRSSASKTFHFLEEVGEIEVEMLRADQSLPNDWQGEIADVFSWLATLFLHVRGYVLQAHGFTAAFDPSSGAPAPGSAPLVPSMETVMRTIFLPGGHPRCPRCGRAPCEERTQRR